MDPVSFTVFTQIFDLINNSILSTLSGKTGQIIGMITPVIMVGFSLYVMLIIFSYGGKSSGDEMFIDLIKRLIAWGVIISLGLNIGLYTSYVVPFFNGLGAELSGVFTGTPTSGAMLDSVVITYLTKAQETLDEAGLSLDLIPASLIIIVSGLGILFVLAVAAAYIILAQIALGILLVIGPIFISLALFPATRKFFDAWIGQCINYVLLTVLFNFLASIQINFVATNIQGVGFFVMFAVTTVISVVFILVSFNLPALASSLAGGVGISSMVGKPLQAMSGVAGAAKSAAAVSSKAQTYVQSKLAGGNSMKKA